MAKIEKFEDLECWKAARELVKEIFLICSKKVLSKDFEMQSQIKRAGISTMNNIAEGFSRFHKKEFVRFLDFSQSSAGEVKSMIYILEDLEYITINEATSLHLKTDKTRNLTLGLIKYLSSTIKANNSQY